MRLYSEKTLNIETIWSKDNIVLKDLQAEFDLQRTLMNIPKIYLDMKYLTFRTSDESFEYVYKDNELSIKITMTNFTVEVER